MGREGGHLGGLKNIFLCTVFFLQIGLEALLNAGLGPDSGLLLNTNREQQDSKGHKLCWEIFLSVSFLLSFIPQLPQTPCPSVHSWVSLG